MASYFQIKKLYYSPIKSFNFIESESVNIQKDLGIENDRIFAFVRNKTKQEAIKFQNKQYLRNNQSYLSVKNTPLLNSYQVLYEEEQLSIFKEKKELVKIFKYDFDSLQTITDIIKQNENELENKEIYLVYNPKIMINN